VLSEENVCKIKKKNDKNETCCYLYLIFIILKRSLSVFKYFFLFLKSVSVFVILLFRMSTNRPL
jgi:hypothetical protein